MEKIASLLPFVLMITVIYFTYKFFINKKSQPQNVEELNNQKLWKKSKMGSLYRHTIHCRFRHPQ